MTPETVAALAGAAALLLRELNRIFESRARRQQQRRTRRDDEQLPPGG